MRIETVDVNGVRLAIQQRGNSAPTVVFVSGLGEPGRIWDPVLGRLSVAARLVTYDRAGVGASDRLPKRLQKKPQAVSWLADQLHDLLERVGSEAPYVLVGHSIGGMIVDAYATRRPADVAGLVFVDATDLAFDEAIDNPRPMMVDGAEPGGLPIGREISLKEFRSQPPTAAPGHPAVVIGSAPWRWLTVTDAEEYAPLTLADADQRWQRFQLDLTQRWHGHLVVPHHAGHRVHEEAPELVARVVDAVATAVHTDRPIALEQAELDRAGGSVRVTCAPGLGMRAWSPAVGLG